MTFKEILIKSIVAILGAGLVAYAIWLCMQDAQVLHLDGSTENLIALVFIGIIGLFLLGAVFFETILPDNRRGVLLLGIGLIWTSHVYLTDTPEASIYLQDIMKLIGMFLCIAGPTKVLQSKRYEEKKFEEEIEVIEV